MSSFMRKAGGLRLVAVLGAALIIAGCAQNRGQDAAGAGMGAGMGMGAGAATPGSQQDFATNVGDRVYFDTDSTDLRPEGRATLDRQAQWLARYPQFAVLIEGHADERGTREYNLALGARRAQTVSSYLASRGVNPSRLRTISYGKERPVAVCNDISCWSQNRRGVTTLDTARTM